MSESNTTPDTDGNIDSTFKADEVREMLDRIQAENYTHTYDVATTIEGFTKEVVETGTFTPNCSVTADVSLPLKERLLGHREQDVTAMLIIGLMIGTALERDVPKDTALEDAWEDGAFKLPKSNTSTQNTKCKNNGGD